MMGLEGKETDTSISINRATGMLLANEKKADATTIRASSTGIWNRTRGQKPTKALKM